MRESRLMFRFRPWRWLYTVTLTLLGYLLCGFAAMVLLIAIQIDFRWDRDRAARR